MVLEIPNVIPAGQVAQFRQALDSSEWIDGRASAGYQAAQVKDNLQMPPDHPVATRLGELILEILSKNPLFMSAALPLHFLPPMFNCYSEGQQFGTHVDSAIHYVRNSTRKIRTDLSCTLFLADPESYDGGELVIEDTYGTKRVKLPAGHLVLYPSTSLHHVTPVTRGARVSSFFWLQSVVRDTQQRSILFDLDVTIQQLAKQPDNQAAVVQLSGIYHNLLRQWAQM